MVRKATIALKAGANSCTFGVSAWATNSCTHGSPKQGYGPCVEFDCTVMSLMEGARPLRFEGIIHRLVLLLYCTLLDVQPATNGLYAAILGRRTPSFCIPSVG